MICISDSSDDEFMAAKEKPAEVLQPKQISTDYFASDGAQYYFREISAEDKMNMFKKIQHKGHSIAQVAAEHGVMMQNLRFWYLDWINQNIVKSTRVKERRASDLLTFAYNKLMQEEQHVDYIDQI